MDRAAGKDGRRRGSAGTLAVHQVPGVHAQRVVRVDGAVHVGAAGYGEAAADHLAARRVRRPGGRRPAGAVLEETDGQARTVHDERHAAGGLEVLRGATVPAGRRDVLRGRFQ